MVLNLVKLYINIINPSTFAVNKFAGFSSRFPTHENRKVLGRKVGAHIECMFEPVKETPSYAGQAHSSVGSGSVALVA
jgi:hypothetical protein